MFGFLIEFVEPLKNLKPSFSHISAMKTKPKIGVRLWKGSDSCARPYSAYMMKTHHLAKALVCIFQAPLLGNFLGITLIYFLLKKNHAQLLGVVKDFFWACWYNHMISAFEFTYMMNYIYWFTYVEPSLHLWYKANLIMINDILDVV